MKYFHKILFLIDYKYSLIFSLLFLFLFISLLETFSIAIIIPFLTVISEYQNPQIPVIGTIEFFSNLNNKSLILFFGSLMIITLIVRSLFTIFCWYLIYHFSWTNIIKLRSKLIDIYQNFDYELYIQKNSSEYIQNISVLTGNFTKLILIPMFKFTSDFILAVFIAAFLAYTDPILFLIILIFFSLGSFFMYSTFKNRLTYYSRSINLNSVKLLTEISNIFRGYKELKIYNKGKFFKNKIIDFSSNIANFQIRSNLINLIPRHIIEITIASLTVFGIFYLFVLNTNDFDELLPKIIVFVIAALRLSGPVSSMNVSLNSIKLGLYTMDIIYNDLKNSKNIKINNKSNPDNAFNNLKNIKFQNVCYRYPGQNIDAVHDVNTSISKNQIIGIYGESGSGKTTFLDLLLGFLIPYKGFIFYNDNLKITKNNINLLQSKIAYIPQDIFITNDTFTKNITLEEQNTNNIDDLKNAIDSANLKDFIKTLKNDLNTVVGDNGINISGGQRQRVSIARAFYHNRDIIVLDEATNALDSKNERKIIEEIVKIKKDKTIIIISHNHKILDICNKILVFKNGKIIKEGNYGEIFDQ